jgi:RNA polymerase sigma-B factor
MGAADPGIAFIDERDALRAELESLPEREYQVVIMRFFESLTQTEIAERLGISQMHVSRLLARSLGRLRDGLLDSGPDVTVA